MKTIDRFILLACIVALFSALAMTALLSSLYRDQQSVYKKYGQFIELRNKAINEVEDRSYLTANMQAFSVVMESSKVGTTQRRTWIEGLRSAKGELKLPEMQFDIYPIATINTDPTTYAINVSQETIELRLGLLHEGELLKLLDYLEHKIPSPYEITALDVQRVDSKEDNDITLPQEINIQVSCTIRWYSIGLVGETIDQV